MAEYKKVKFYYDKELAVALSNKISIHHKNFDQKSFVSCVCEKVEDLEYKDRVRVFAKELKRHLPPKYDRALKILVNILGAENKQQTGMFSEGYWIAPIAYFVEIYGLDNYSLSMDALAEITKRHTSEYAVRPYLESYPETAIKQMLKWSKAKNFHLRRLASEGMRPRLPWANKLSMFIEDPSPIVPILENLKNDEVRYVQKSVANCLNDILKDNYDFAMTLIERWSMEQASNQTRWIINHSLRKLKKTEDPRALVVLDRVGM